MVIIRTVSLPAYSRFLSVLRLCFIAFIGDLRTPWSTHHSVRVGTKFYYFSWSWSFTDRKVNFFDPGPVAERLVQLGTKTDWPSVNPWLLFALERSLRTFESLLLLISPIIPGPTIPNQNFHRVKQVQAIKYFASPFLIKIHFRFWFMAIIILKLNKIILFFDNLNDVIMM